jgi:hypothetical protein
VYGVESKAGYGTRAEKSCEGTSVVHVGRNSLFIDCLEKLAICALGHPAVR